MPSPTEAYEAAKASRAKRQQEAIAVQSAVDSFPSRAEARLRECDTALKASLPEGLTLESSFNTAGDLMDRGVKGLFLRLSEHGTVVAQATVNCASDEIVFMTGYPPIGDKRPKREFGEMPFAKLTPDAAVNFLGQLIGMYV